MASATTIPTSAPLSAGDVMPALITDLDFIAEQARDKADNYDAFRYYIELDEREDAELDALVESLANPIIAQIDCTQCGNCCRSLDVYLTPEDAPQLAKGLNLSVDTVRARFIDHPHAEVEDEWGMLRERPCAFLKGNLCDVYAHRPESCRDYPAFTPDFRWQAEYILGGVGLCPIIYNVMEALKHHLNW